MSTRLSPKEKAFVHAYVDKDNPKTFGNGTQSALKAYKHKTEPVAASQASNMLRKPKIQNYLELVCEDQDMGIADRVRILAATAHGRTTKRTESYRVEDGIETLSGVVVAEPPHRDRISAIDVLNKATGAYDRAHEAVKIEAEEWRKLCSDVFK